MRQVRLGSNRFATRTLSSIPAYMVNRRGTIRVDKPARQRLDREAEIVVGGPRRLLNERRRFRSTPGHSPDRRHSRRGLPEPSTGAFAGLALAALFARRRVRW